jgi:hypothetical protein
VRAVPHRSGRTVAWPIMRALAPRMFIVLRMLIR